MPIYDFLTGITIGLILANIIIFFYYKEIKR